MTEETVKTLLQTMADIIGEQEGLKITVEIRNRNIDK